MRVPWMALALGVAACGKTGSGDSMASAGNALSPEEIDAALGPEPSGQDVTEPAENISVEPVQPAAAAEPEEEEESASTAVRSQPRQTAEHSEAPAQSQDDAAEQPEQIEN